MIAFILTKPAYKMLQEFHFVIIDFYGKRAKWSRGRFMIHEDWKGGYSYFRICPGEGPGGSIAVDKVHHATEIFQAPYPDEKNRFAQFPCHYEGDKLVEGGFEDDYL